MTDPGALAEAVRRGDRRALARAITLVESSRPDHRVQAEALIERLAAAPAADSLRLGISGVPGVGKSTFIEAFGRHVLSLGHRVAVLAVDPSSPLSGGAILGDKTRMDGLSRDPRAFIRPSPAGATLGGVARRTADAIALVEAAGFGVVLVETVGVGQSETAVAELTDLFCLLLPPAGGDSLQGIKKGIVELADLLVVTKADGDTAAAAGRAVADYQAALHLLRAADPGWSPPVLACSSVTGAGIADIWAAMARFRNHARESGRWQKRREDQRLARLWREVTELVVERLRRDPGVAAAARAAEAEVAQGRLPPAVAARRLLAALGPITE